MKVYISGPATGHPDDNLPAFLDAAHDITAAFHDPIVPHCFVTSVCSWEAAMRACIRIMMSADAVLVLPGWEKSRGACLEVQIATALSIPVDNDLDSLLRGAIR
ncbi:MAG: hypothetical protein A2001_01540 [Treponema sp. GWC1_61_84]|nr:MAG: hypothetical protein A2001_01540 [Treponema sp. GWC1_61_84]